MTALTFTTSQRILLILALLMLVWYVIGTWYSRRRGIRALSWLREGLGPLGEEVRAAWIGSAASGAKVASIKAAPPFQQLEATFLLESRELLPLWLVNLLRGKRDELVIKAHLRSPRRGEMEVVPSGGRLERSLRRRLQSSWKWDSGPHGLCIAHRGVQGKTLVSAAQPLLQRYGLSLRRFAWRRDKPHLILHIRLAGLTDSPPNEFFNDLIAVIAYPKRSLDRGN
jgi:hypothetical protein